MRKVLFCCTGIDDFLNGSSKVAGIQVQMSFWALTFQQNGYDCYSFSVNNGVNEVDGIRFIYKKNYPFLQKIKLASVFEWFFLSRSINRINPNIVIIRGASASLAILSRCCKKKGIKLIMFGASDSDFVPGKEILTNSINAGLFRRGVRNTVFFVVQNSYQQNTLSQNYKKDSLLLPNIWLDQQGTETHNSVYDAIWVSNLRRLKRAEWFVELAQSNPLYHFAIVGGANDITYYREIEKACSSIPNIDFLGPRSFKEVNDLISQSRLLICTSEFEGFPNTFLQAWSQGLPVISTVDPNGILKEYNVGMTIESINDLKEAFNKFITNTTIYQEYKKSVVSYFKDRHSARSCFELLCKYSDV